MQHLSRTNALKIAAILSLLLGLLGFFSSLPLLARGAALDLSADAPPYVIILAAFIFAILRIIGAYGAWMQQRWGIVVTILANALDGILALPGLLFAPSLGLWLSAIIGVVGGVVIIVLCLWRDPKPATPQQIAN